MGHDPNGGSSRDARLDDRGGRADGRVYAAIDLKSFYASVECRERGLDPLTTNLVVADVSRTDKTICLAVSPSLKSYGISGRPRLFEVVRQVRQINDRRLAAIGGGGFSGSSCDDVRLRADPSLRLDYIAATPQMAKYMAVSSSIYDVYLDHVAPEDIHVYSIDEVFVDLTPYLRTYSATPRELTARMIHDVLDRTGITATAGIGTNMYLAKVAMDIVAKHVPADADGVRIAELDERSYRRCLWTHRPITDFWRIGPGYAAKLAANGMQTMGDVARQSVRDEELLYRLFGVNAEYLIDHAWGVEPTTIADIRSYTPKASTLGSGQVLPEPYTHERARVVVREMAESLALDLVDKGLVCDQVVLAVGFDRESLRAGYEGEVAVDYYGRAVPRHAHGTSGFDAPTSSTRRICEAALDLFDRCCDPSLLIRRINIVAGNVQDERHVAEHRPPEQLSLFDDPEEVERRRAREREELDRERRAQEKILEIKRRFGKNAILKGTSYVDGARARERNEQIGGHKA